MSGHPEEMKTDFGSTYSGVDGITKTACGGITYTINNWPNHENDCPHCGRCPNCGRGGYTPPYYPYPTYQPYRWYTTSPNWTVPNNNTIECSVMYK